MSEEFNPVFKMNKIKFSHHPNLQRSSGCGKKNLLLRMLLTDGYNGLTKVKIKIYLNQNIKLF